MVMAHGTVPQQQQPPPEAVVAENGPVVIPGPELGHPPGAVALIHCWPEVICYPVNGYFKLDEVTCCP